MWAEQLLLGEGQFERPHGVAFRSVHSILFFECGYRRVQRKHATTLPVDIRYNMLMMSQ
ncbi:hypothetical protein CHS0354_041888, partial [Potamilus streckersoni]